MTVLEFGHPLTHNVKARDPVGSKNDYQSSVAPELVPEKICRRAIDSDF